MVHLKYLDESGCWDIAQQVMFKHYSWQQKRHIAKATARARDQYLGSVEQVSFEYALMLGSLTKKLGTSLAYKRATLVKSCE